MREGEISVLTIIPRLEKIICSYHCFFDIVHEGKNGKQGGGFMKKITVFGVAIALVFFSFSSCKRETVAPKAGQASVDDMLRLVPEDANGVIFIDFHKAVSTEIADKAIKESKDYQKYQEFIQMTGIDPQKDIYFVTVALSEVAQKVEEGAIVNMKFDKEALLTLVRKKAEEEGQEVREEDYNGIPIYTLWEEKGEPDYFTFLDDSNIIAGKDVLIKSVIDVMQKRKENVLKNKALSDLIAKTDKNAMIWGSVLIPSEAMDKVTSENPMLANLQSVNAVSLAFDYKDKNVIAEIKAMSGNEEKNKQVADLLNGFKAMGGMLASQKPEIGELINSIEITSAPDHVKIYAKVPEEVINKLKAKKETE